MDVTDMEAGISCAINENIGLQVKLVGREICNRESNKHISNFCGLYHSYVDDQVHRQHQVTGKMSVEFIIKA